MAPAFLMPDRIEAIGAATPVGLGLAAFAPALWSGGGFAAAGGALLSLTLMGACGLALARIASRASLAPSA